MPRSAPIAALLFLLTLLGGCTSAPQTRQLLTQDNPPLARQALLSNVPFYAQEEYQCGPAALAMTLGHTGMTISPETLVPQVYLPGRQGSLQAELVATARRYDRLPYQHPPSLQALFAALDRNHPVLVLQNLGLDSLPQWHYAVLIGYDLAEQTVTLHSGVTERMVRPMDLFEQSWRRGGHWALSLLDPQDPPFGLDPRRYLQAALDLRKSGRDAAASAAMSSARRSWPDSPLPWMLEGNRLYATNQYQSAEHAFREALKRDNRQPNTWNNLAYALGQQGCHREAKAAINCALDLSPDNENLLHSQQELATLAQQPAGSAEHCAPVACSFSASKAVKAAQIRHGSP